MEGAIKEIVFGGVLVAHVCERCNGKGGGYLTEIKPDGKRGFVYRSGSNIDPLWESCIYCSRGVIDTEEGELIRRWLNGK